MAKQCPHCGAVSVTSPNVEWGGWVLNRELNTLNGKRLSPTHMQIAGTLLRAKGGTVSLEQLAPGIYGTSDGPENELVTLRSQMYRIRQALKPLDVHLKNVPRLGYYLEKITTGGKHGTHTA